MSEDTIQPVELKRTNPDFSGMDSDVSTPKAARMLTAINARMSGLNEAASNLKDGQTPGNVYGLT